MTVTRHECRFGQPCVPTSFRQRLCCAVQHHPELRAEQIAERAHVPYRWLLAYGNENEDRHIPAEALTAIVRVTGRIDLLEHLARELGYRVLPELKALSPEDLVTEALDLTSAHGQLIAEVRKAYTDRRIQPIERQRLLELTRAVHQQLAELESAVGIAAGSRPVQVGSAS